MALKRLLLESPPQFETQCSQLTKKPLVTSPIVFSKQFDNTKRDLLSFDRKPDSNFESGVSGVQGSRQAHIKD